MCLKKKSLFTVSNILYRSKYLLLDLRILHNGGCSVKKVYSIYNSIEKICDIANSRYEWNPVCASDGVTYPNPFEFLCYQAGKYLQFILCYHLFSVKINDFSLLGFSWFKANLQISHIYFIARLSSSRWMTLFVRLHRLLPSCISDSRSLVSDDECGRSTQISCANLTTSVSAGGTITPEDEVCGSDGVTYQSIHHLQCYNSQNKC